MAGGVLAWRVCPLPRSRGQISNVSAFVLPVRMPVAEDGPVFPGDPGGDDSPHDRLLFHILRQQADAVRFLTEINRELLQNALNARRALEERKGTTTTVDAESKPKRQPIPQNKEHRTWSGFRADLQRFEASVRRVNQLTAEDEVTEEAIYAAGGPHPRTLKRTMVLTYGLSPNCWPPSTWPEHWPAS